MTFAREKLPRVITFLYVPDEPRPPEYPRIVTLADNIHSNAGPGRALPFTRELRRQQAPAMK